MIELTEGDLTFLFPDGWQADQLDKWHYYHHHFKRVADGVKCVDFLAIDSAHRLWLIEVKDYRRDRKTTASELSEAVVEKVRNSLGLLMAASIQSDPTHERDLARQAARQDSLRVVLHMEQPRHRSRLRPTPIDPSSIRQVLRKRLKVTGVAEDVRVVSRDRAGHFPWQVE